MKGNTQLVKWLRSMLLILIPMLLMCTVLCAYVLNSYRESILQNNTVLAKSSQNIVDERFREFVHLANYLLISQDNSELIHLQEPPNPIPQLAYQFSDRINELVVGNDALSGAFIYYPNSDFVVGNLGCYSSHSYYVLHGFPWSQNYSSWMETLKNNSSSSLIQLRFSNRTQLCYIRTYMKESKPAAVIVLELDQEKISELISTALYSDDSAGIFLLDGAPFFGIGDPQLLSNDYSWVIEKPFEANDGIFCFYNDSSVLPNVSLLHIYSVSSLMRGLRSVIIVCITVLTVCFVCGVFLAVYLSRKNAAPVDNIIHKLSSRGAPENMDDISFISKQIDQMMATQFKNEQRMNEYQLHLDDLFTSSILHGQYESEAEIFDLAVHYGITFTFPFYQIIVLRIPEQEQVFVKEYSCSIRELSIQRMDLFVSTRKNTLVILVNSEEPLSDDEIRSVCETIFEKVLPNIPVCAGIGYSCDSALSIAKSFRFAVSSLEKALSMGPRSVCIFEDNDAAKHDELSPDKAFHTVYHKKKLAEEAKQIVDDHFTDSMLGVYSVAAQLNISNSYLSTLFKSAYGISMLQYINQLRINYAKELLLNTNTSIKDIASMVGFSSDISFIRAFRRFENCTPTSVRNTVDL